MGRLKSRFKMEDGDAIEVVIEDENTIILRRVSNPPNRGLMDLLLACPVPFDIPIRDRDDSDSPL